MYIKEKNIFSDNNINLAARSHTTSPFLSCNLYRGFTTVPGRDLVIITLEDLSCGVCCKIDDPSLPESYTNITLSWLQFLLISPVRVHVIYDLVVSGDDAILLGIASVSVVTQTFMFSS